MREYRARKRESAVPDGASLTGVPAGIDLAAMDLAAFAESSAGDPDAVTVPVRLSAAQFAKLARLMRAIEARHGAKVKADAAMRLAVEVAHWAIAGTD